MSGLQRLREFNARYPGHEVIGHNEVDWATIHNFKSFVRGLSRGHLVSCFFEDQLSQNQRIVFVIHTQDHRFAMYHDSSKNQADRADAKLAFSVTTFPGMNTEKQV